MFDIGFKAGEVVSHDDVCRITGCGCMGGIRYSKENNVLVLFMKDNSQYENAWDGDILKYMGCGKGDQSIETQGNKRLAESQKQQTDVFLFEWEDLYLCRFIGRMILAGAPYYEMHKNKYGIPERKVIFLLQKAG